MVEISENLVACQQRGFRARFLLLASFGSKAAREHFQENDFARGWRNLIIAEFRSDDVSSGSRARARIEQIWSAVAQTAETDCFVEEFSVGPIVDLATFIERRGLCRSRVDRLRIRADTYRRD
jgi:hypothetical protein